MRCEAIPPYAVLTPDAEQQRVRRCCRPGGRAASTGWAHPLRLLVVEVGAQATARGNTARRPAEPVEPPGAESGSERADVLRLRTFLALGDVEFHPLVLIKAAEAARRDRGEVGEDVGAAAVLGDEAEALVGVEP